MQSASFFDVFRCSTCHAIFRDASARGGNTFGAVHWSDGWLEAPMLDQRPPIVLCPRCAAPIWRGRLHAIGKGMYDSNGDCDYRKERDKTASEAVDWQAAPHADRPTLTALLHAADAFMGHQPEAELETRIWIWWRSNDQYRKEGATWIVLPRRPPEHVASVNRLRTLLRVKGRNHQLMLAELQRESEQHEDCLASLAAIVRGKHALAALKLRQLAREAESRLVSLSSFGP